jgi:hypothetical protein
MPSVWWHANTIVGHKLIRIPPSDACKIGWKVRMPNPETRPSKGLEDYQIHLNFLPVEITASRCLIYRRRCASAQEERPVPQATAHKLPAVDVSEKDWETYWVIQEATDGFHAIIAPSYSGASNGLWIDFDERRRGRLRGSLHGIPILVKDSMGIGEHGAENRCKQISSNLFLDIGRVS